jgi:hypothetical protein
VNNPFKKPKLCLIFGSVNLLLMGLVGVMRVTHFGCCKLGGPANVLAVAIIPGFLIVSLVFIIIDAFRPHARSQAMLATILSIPSAAMTFYAWTTPF